MDVWGDKRRVSEANSVACIQREEENGDKLGLKEEAPRPAAGRWSEFLA